jgi:hypothetical protein
MAGQCEYAVVEAARTWLKEAFGSPKALLAWRRIPTPTPSTLPSAVE